MSAEHYSVIYFAPAPCEHACAHVDRCRDQKLACVAFAGYVAYRPGWQKLRRANPTHKLWAKLFDPDMAERIRK